MVDTTAVSSVAATTVSSVAATAVSSVTATAVLSLLFSATVDATTPYPWSRFLDQVYLIEAEHFAKYIIF